MPSHSYGDEWESAIFKRPVSGPVMLESLNLKGDEQADLVHHGGSDQAALAYSADHYDAWQELFALSNLEYGSFGENFTISGQDESSVCIGDVCRIGEATVQITRMRIPCWKQERRLNRPGLVEEMLDSARCGWYYRVLEPGLVEAGNGVEVLERPYPHISVVRLLRALYDKHNLKEAAVMAECTALAERLRPVFVDRLNR